MKCFSIGFLKHTTVITVYGKNGIMKKKFTYINIFFIFI